MKFLRIIASESKMFRFYVLFTRLPLTHQRGIEMEKWLLFETARSDSYKALAN